MTKFTKQLRSAGGDGDAAYCWAKCVQAADQIEELLQALQTLLDAVNGNRITLGDCMQARAAIAKAEQS